MSLTAAIDAELAKRKATDDQDALRREYIQLLMANDPAKAGRLIDLASELGVSPDAMKDDLAKVQNLGQSAAQTAEQQAAQPGAPTPPRYTPQATGMSQGECDYANSMVKFIYSGNGGMVEQPF